LNKAQRKNGATRQIAAGANPAMQPTNFVSYNAWRGPPAPDLRQVQDLRAAKRYFEVQMGLFP
jgi:hypothetical protein